MKKTSVLCGVIILMLAGNSFAQNTRESKPYIIYEKSTFLQITIEKMKNGIANSITFDTKNVSGGSPLLRGIILPPAVISSIDALQGSFTQKQVLSNSVRGQVFVLKDLRFPYRARFTLSPKDDVFDIEFTEPGSYTVNVAQNR